MNDDDGVRLLEICGSCYSYFLREHAVEFHISCAEFLLTYARSPSLVAQSNARYVHVWCELGSSVCVCGEVSVGAPHLSVDSTDCIAVCLSVCLVVCVVIISCGVFSCHRCC